MAYKDITQTGPQTWRTLQNENSLDIPPEQSIWYEEHVTKKLNNQHLPENFYGIASTVPTSIDVSDTNLVDYGNSRYDSEVATLDELMNYQDYRGRRQSGFNKLAAGVGKGIALAGTTFVDGTLGLLVGGAEALVNWDISKVWNNEISNSLREMNEELERIMPNYQTDYEKNRAWYQNLGTMNFWADTFIKNLGFTVGAFYSGNVWTKALRDIGALKSAASAQVVGSVMSAVNEGRIEANNNSYDFLQAQREQLRQGYDKALSDIQNNISGEYLTQEAKNDAINKLNAQYQRLDRDAQQRADAMGLAVLIGNTAILSISNLWQFGKLYSRGFDNAKGIMGRIQSGMTREGITGGIKEGGRYTAKQFSRPKAITRAVSNGLMEGFEEMNQALIAEHAGLYRSSDDPDAYYKALIDPEHQYRTRERTAAFTEAFANTYGSKDRWSEFAVGALTGLIGQPTFGRVNNSDANTYLGKGKLIGLSGGVWGEFRSQKEQAAERERTAKAMNDFVDKINQSVNHFSQGNYFTNAMDGWAEENNQFEWTNARDNEMFAGFSAFRKAGRLNEYYDIIDQDFENLSDEKLQEIALNTTPNVELNEDGTAKRVGADGKVLTEGWRDPKTGQLLSETEEGRQQMREELAAKRDRIKSALQSYEKALSSVRGIGNNALTDDQENEMAWLKWKTDIFKDRYSDIKNNNESFVNNLSSAIDKFLYRQSGQLLDEKNAERVAQGKSKLGGRAKAKYAPLNISDSEQATKIMNTIKEYLTSLKEADSPAVMASMLKYSPEIVDVLNNLNTDLLKEYMDIDIDNFKKSITDLQDIARISTSYQRFNEQYEKFTKNPLELEKNRERIEKENQKTQETVNRVQQNEAVKDMSVSDIIKQDVEGNIDLDNIDLGNFDEAAVGKLEEAKAVKDTKNNLIKKVESSDADAATKKAALEMLENFSPDSVDELIDLNNAAYNDASLLEVPESVLRAVSEEERTDKMEELVSNSKSLLAKSIATLENESADLPNVGEISVENVEAVEEETTGRDNTVKHVTINEEQKQHFEETKKESKKPNPRNRLETASAMMTYITNHREQPLTEQERDGLESALISLIGTVSREYDKGSSLDAIMKAIMPTDAYRIADGIFPVRSLLENYFKGLNNYEDAVSEETQKPADKVEQPQDITPEVVDNDIDTEITDSSNRKENKESKPYNYWKTTSSQLPIINPRFNTTPFWKMAQSLGYNGALLQRIKAVGDFFEKEGVFDRVNNGEAQKGDKVGFRIIKDLNDKAGSIVILITDKNGNIIGDMPALTDSTVKDYIGLETFLQNIINEYEKAGSPDTFDSSYTSVVDKNMVGKVPYVQTRATLNKVFGNTPFKLGIAMQDGVTSLLATPGITKQDNDPIRNMTLPALNAKKGQPYLLLPTSDKTGNRQYIPVPFITDRYNQTMQGTTFDNIITDLLTSLFSRNNSNVMPVINELKEFFALPELHVNYDSEGRMSIHIRTDNMERQVPIFTPKFYEQWNGDVTTAVSSIKQALYRAGIPVQISRKYINTNYKDYNYNNIIGELAKVNLAEGSTHTISDWFTIKMVDANGKVVDTKSPKSTGINPTTKPVETKLTVNNQDPTTVLTRNGLLGTIANQQVWESLTSEQQQIIASKSKPKQSQLMQQLVAAKAMGNSIDEILGVRNRIAEGKREPFDIEKELSWLNKVLPQFSIDENKQLIAGLTNMKGNLSLWGTFRDGLIYLNSSNNSRGTVYHEAFHAVFNCLISDTERKNILNRAKEIWGELDNVSLEEKLAEDFREYTQLGEYSDSLFKHLWKSLLRIIRNIFNRNDVLTTLYRNINNGNFSSITPSEFIGERNRVDNDITETERRVSQLEEDYKQAKDRIEADIKADYNELRNMASSDQTQTVVWRNVIRKEGSKAQKKVLVGNIKAVEGQDVSTIGETIPNMLDEKFKKYLGDTFVSAGYIFKPLIDMQEAISNNKELRAIEKDLNNEKETLKNLKNNREELQSNELLEEQGEIEYRDNNFDMLSDSEQQAWLKIADKKEFNSANKEVKDHCGY